MVLSRYIMIKIIYSIIVEVDICIIYFFGESHDLMYKIMCVFIWPQERHHEKNE